jgi:hypothetical protein
MRNSVRLQGLWTARNRSHSRNRAKTRWPRTSRVETVQEARNRRVFRISRRRVPGLDWNKFWDPETETKCGGIFLRAEEYNRRSLHRSDKKDKRAAKPPILASTIEELVLTEGFWGDWESSEGSFGGFHKYQARYLDKQRKHREVHRSF